jgi:hypothetical protein
MASAHEMVNRNNGNFETNYITLTGKYLLQSNNFRELKPYDWVFSVSFGTTYYLPTLGFFGGISELDEEFYGTRRWHFSSEYSTRKLKWLTSNAMTFRLDFDYIEDSFETVRPWRAEISMVFQGALSLPDDMGLFLSYTNGHDNYNLRFVDFGQQLAFGIEIDVFPHFNVR